MSALEHPIAAEMKRLLDERVPNASEQQVSQIEGPIVRGEQSVIYKASYPGFPRSLLIKRLHDAGRTARSQYDALLMARERLHGQRGLLVPNAYPYLLDEGFIMMDWFAAPTLGQLLQNPKFRVSNLISTLTRTGQWLRAFHGERELELGPIKVDQMLDYIFGMADDPRFSKNLSQTRRHRDLLKMIASTVRQIAIPVSYSHGDFKPDNVLIEEDHVITIDIGRIFHAPVIHDLTHFLIHLELHLLHPSGWRLLPWRRRLRSAFLYGYKLELTTKQLLVLTWLELQRTLQYFYEEFEENQSRDRISRKFLQLCSRRCAQLRAQDLHRVWNQVKSSDRYRDDSFVR